MDCPYCKSKNIVKNGSEKRSDGSRQQVLKCKDCKKSFRPGAVSVPEVTIQKVGLTEQELRKKYDLNYKVDAGVNNLQPGVFLTDFEFVKNCGIMYNGGYRIILDSGKYDKYKGRAQKTVYWSHPDSIKKMKDEGVL